MLKNHQSVVRLDGVADFETARSNALTWVLPGLVPLKLLLLSRSPMMKRCTWSSQTTIGSNRTELGSGRGSFPAAYQKWLKLSVTGTEPSLLESRSVWLTVSTYLTGPAAPQESGGV